MTRKKEKAPRVAQMVKNLPAIQETHVRTLGQEDPLEKGMATYSSILSWRIPQRSLASYSPWGHKVPDTTEWLTHTHSLLQSPFLCCCCSITMSCLTLCDPRDCAGQAPLSSTVYRIVFKFMSFASVMLTSLSSAAPFSFCLQSFPTSGPSPMSPLFTSGGQRYWGFSFSNNPSREHSGLISFRIDWFDLFAVQGTLKSLLISLITNKIIHFFLFISHFFCELIFHADTTSYSTFLMILKSLFILSKVICCHIYWKYAY